MGGGAAAAGFLLFLRRDLELLRKAGAISYETRKSAVEAGLNENQLGTLVSVGWAQKSDDGKYYVILKNKRHS